MSRFRHALRHFRLFVFTWHAAGWPRRRLMSTYCRVAIAGMACCHRMIFSHARQLSLISLPLRIFRRFAASLRFDCHAIALIAIFSLFRFAIGYASQLAVS